MIIRKGRQLREEDRERERDRENGIRTPIMCKIYAKLINDFFPGKFSTKFPVFHCIMMKLTTKNLP